MYGYSGMVLYRLYMCVGCGTSGRTAGSVTGHGNCQDTGCVARQDVTSECGRAQQVTRPSTVLAPKLTKFVSKLKAVKVET